MEEIMKQKRGKMMLKTLAAQIKEYKKPSILTPIFMILEVILETLIPFFLQSLVDNGVNKGDMGHIVFMGGIMVVLAAGGLTKTCGRLCTTIYRPTHFPI